MSKFFYYLLVILFFSGSNSPLIYAQITEEKNNQKNSIGVDYLKNLPDYNYIIGPGDSLSITVSRDYPELTISSTTVDSEGTIYLPKLNRVYVQNLSINELNNILNEAYRKYVKYPEVEIQIKDYRPIRVFVRGEVVSPGVQTLPGSISLFELTQNSVNSNSINNQITKTFNESLTNNYFPTVFDAIRKSGGTTQFSDLSSIQVIRKNNLSSGGGKIITNLNFRNLLLEGDETQNIRIYDSDIINIKKTNSVDNSVFRKAALSNLNPKFLSVSVYGRVKSPGTIKVSRSSVLTDAIDIAGGVKVLRGPVTYLRFNNDGTIDKRKFSYRKNAKRGTFKNPYLRQGDLIVIGNSALAVTTEVLNEVTAPISGIVSTFALVKILTD